MPWILRAFLGGVVFFFFVHILNARLTRGARGFCVRFGGGVVFSERGGHFWRTFSVVVFGVCMFVRLYVCRHVSKYMQARGESVWGLGFRV